MDDWQLFPPIEGADVEGDVKDDEWASGGGAEREGRVRLRALGHRRLRNGRSNSLTPLCSASTHLPPPEMAPTCRSLAASVAAAVLLLGFCCGAATGVQDEEKVDSGIKVMPLPGVGVGGWGVVWKLWLMEGGEGRRRGESVWGEETSGPTARCLVPGKDPIAKDLWCKPPLQRLAHPTCGRVGGPHTGLTCHFTTPDRE